MVVEGNVAVFLGLNESNIKNEFAVTGERYLSCLKT